MKNPDVLLQRSRKNNLRIYMEPKNIISSQAFIRNKTKLDIVQYSILNFTAKL